MKRLATILMLLLAVINAWSQTDDFNPPSPPAPYANVFNPQSGELMISYIPADESLGDAVDDAFVTMGYEVTAAAEIRSVTINCSLRSSDFGFFNNLPNSVTIDLSNMTGVTTIPEQFCLAEMSNLDRIIFPKGIEKIEATLSITKSAGYVVLSGTPNLRWLVVHADRPPTVPQEFLTEHDYMGGNRTLRPMTICVPKASLEAYRNHEIWGRYNIIAIEGSETQQLSSATVVVTTPDGDDVTDRVNVRWTNMSGVELSKDNRVSEVAEGEQAMYVVTLPYEMTLDYQTPPSGVVTGDGQDHVVRLQLEEWPYNAFIGTKMGVSYNFTPVDGISSDGLALLGGDDLQFSVKDVTAGETIDDFQYDGAQLKFTQLLPAMHTLEVTLSSKSHLFRTATERVTTHFKGGCDVHFDLVENGRTLLNYDIVAEQEYMCLVCTPDGTRMASARGKDGTFTVSHLPDGDYLAYIMFYDANTYNIPQVTALYKSNESSSICEIVGIKAEAGREHVYQVKVPAKALVLNHYGGSISSNKSELSLGERIDVTLHAILGSGISGISDERMIVEMPEGMSYVEGSMLIRQGDYSCAQEGRRLIILGSPIVTCSFVCDIPGEQTVNLYMEYVKGGQKMTELAASRTFTIANISMYAPNIVNDGSFTVSGNASPGALVTVFDGGQTLGQTVTKLNGEWALPVTVDETLPFHALTAEFVNERDINVTTDMALVHVSPTAPALKRIMMYNENLTVEFNPVSGKVMPAYYSYNPADKNLFTFVAELSNLDPKKIAVPMFVVTTSDDLKYLLKATYDSSVGGYTTYCPFTSSTSVPEHVDFVYDYLDSGYTHELADFMAAQAVASNKAMIEQAQEAMSSDIEVVEVLREDETLTEALLRFKSTDELFVQRIQDEDFEAMQALMATEGLICYGFNCEGDSVVHIFIDSEEESASYYVNLTQRFAFSVRYSFYDPEHPQMPADSYKAFALPMPSHATNAMVRGQHRALPLLAILSAGATLISVASHAKDMYKLAKSNYEARLAQMQNRRNGYANRLHGVLSSINGALSACCADGRFKCDPLHGVYQQKFHELASDVSDFMAQYDQFVEDYQNARDNAVKSEFANLLVDAILTATGGKLVTTAMKGMGRVPGMLRLMLGKSGANNFMDMVFNGMQEIGKSQLPDFETDYDDVYDRFTDWFSKSYNPLLQKLNDLYNSILAAQKDCSDDELDRQVISVDKNYTSTKKRVRPIIDPSGFVYEGVEANRVEGVTATIYYRESEDVSEDDAVLWDAPEYGQQNPLVTAADGFYRWDVPSGLWQVRFHKAGYEDVATEWLPVPPPQLDVNMPMKQSAPSALAAATAYTDGIAFDFTKYMDVSSVEQNTLVSAQGRRIDGKVEALNAEASPAGRNLATQYRFVSSAPIDEKVVSLQIGASTTDYADIALPQAVTRQLSVQHAIETLTVQPLVNAPIGQHVTFVVKATPAVAVEGKPLTVSFGNGAATSPLVDLDATTVIFDAEGTARVGLKGILPGSAELCFSIADKTAQTSVEAFYDLTAFAPIVTDRPDAPAVVYDLSGRRVKRISSLTKGIYIIGGRKVMK